MARPAAIRHHLGDHAGRGLAAPDRGPLAPGDHRVRTGGLRPRPARCLAVAPIGVALAGSAGPGPQAGQRVAGRSPAGRAPGPRGRGVPTGRWRARRPRPAAATSATPSSWRSCAASGPTWLRCTATRSSPGRLLQREAATTGAGVAMSVVRRGRALGLADEDIVARWPVALALTAPRIGAPAVPAAHGRRSAGGTRYRGGDLVARGRPACAGGPAPARPVAPGAVGARRRTSWRGGCPRTCRSRRRSPWSTCA